MTPIDMLLFCPQCSFQHVDAPQPQENWDNPPHRSHECQNCGWVWRPADVPTNGILHIETTGERDKSPIPLKFTREFELARRKSVGNDLAYETRHLSTDDQVRPYSRDTLAILYQQWADIVSA